HYNKLPYKKGDIVRFKKLKNKAKVMYAGENDKGRPMFQPIEGQFDLWCINDNDKKEICYELIKL
ncbi:MAG: hypothetical protein GX638_05980, partial [Crenarchaeota archaeon]|nr:hypothetical protein [Thermoproteota archaeon]